MLDILQKALKLQVVIFKFTNRLRTTINHHNIVGTYRKHTLFLLWRVCFLLFLLNPNNSFLCPTKYVGAILHIQIDVPLTRRLLNQLNPLLNNSLYCEHSCKMDRISFFLLVNNLKFFTVPSFIL
jgi:hypothetical protein